MHAVRWTICCMVVTLFSVVHKAVDLPRGQHSWEKIGGCFSQTAPPKAVSLASMYLSCVYWPIRNVMCCLKWQIAVAFTFKCWYLPMMACIPCSGGLDVRWPPSRIEWNRLRNTGFTVGHSYSGRGRKVQVSYSSALHHRKPLTAASFVSACTPGNEILELGWKAREALHCRSQLHPEIYEML